MNRRIYYDGALINKIGIDRIVIKKVVLKEINAEKLDTALTCCAIHYDMFIPLFRIFLLNQLSASNSGVTFYLCPWPWT